MRVLPRFKDPFWSLARRLADRRVMLIAAVSFAFISAVSLGVGLLGVVGVLDQINKRNPDGSARSLPQLLDDRFGERPVTLPGGMTLPDDLIPLLPTDPFDGVVLLVVGLGVLTFLGAGANFMHRWCSLTASTEAVASIRRDAYQRILAAPLGHLATRSASDTVSRILSDSSELNRGFMALTSRALAQITKGIAALAAAIIIDWRLTLVTLAIAPVLIAIIRMLGRRIRKASGKAMKSKGRMLEAASQALHGFAVVKVFQGEQRELARFEELNRRMVREQLRVRTARAVSNPIIEVVAIVVIGTLCLIAARQIIIGEIDLSEFIMALGSLAVAGNSLKPLSDIVQEIQQASAAAERLDQVMRVAPEHSGSTPVPRHERAIEFRGVRFSYPGAERHAIDGVTLTIPARTTVAFVGPNGCGKSTLLNLVPALYHPQDGAVVIDGIDLRDAELSSLRSQIAFVAQDVVLFRGTVAENIAYGVDGATPERIRAALERAHADSFVDRLPDGVDTVLGDRGSNLSGGQRQRLAIARAILRDPAILILDEATSMIDAESEANIADAIAELNGTRTVLVVAHRFATIARADHIVLMDEGRIADQGTHEELLERSRLYRQIAGQPAPADAPGA